MPRRQTQNRTGIRGTGTVNPSELWFVIECARVGCEQMLRISEEAHVAASIAGVVECPSCGWANDLAWVESGVQMKYCRICERLQPLENFHRHKPTGSSFRTGRQLECRECKNTRINPALNPLRTADQFREASQRRRLLGILAEDVGKLDGGEIFDRFNSRCFNCGTPLGPGSGTAHAFDHTLPLRYLWPMTTASATLLCADCNNRKHDQWPSQFYDDAKLRRLARLTGISYDLLAGVPVLNRAAADAILREPDEFIEDWIDRPDELRRIRQLLITHLGEDLAQHATHAPDWLKA